MAGFSALPHNPRRVINIDYGASNGDLVRWNTVDEVASMLLSGVGAYNDFPGMNLVI